MKNASRYSYPLLLRDAAKNLSTAVRRQLTDGGFGEVAGGDGLPVFPVVVEVETGGPVQQLIHLPVLDGVTVTRGRRQVQPPRRIVDALL